VIYEHEGPWWNDIDKEKILIRPPEISGNTNNSFLVAQQDELAKEITNFAFRSISFILRGVADATWADGFTSPPKEGVLRIIIAFKNPSLAAGFECVNFGSNDKHTNHYTTENDF
jgi:hypothetical protein